MDLEFFITLSTMEIGVMHQGVIAKWAPRPWVEHRCVAGDLEEN